MDKIGNYLNIEAKDRSEAIYRIMPLQRLFGIFEARENILVRPKLWQKEDSHENYVMEGEYVFIDTPARIGYKDRFYCQSWSLEEESKQIWEVRSTDMHGAKVKTSVKKLFESLWNVRNNPYLQDRECFIGQIDYKTLSQIEELAEFYKKNSVECFTDRDMILPALSLLVKTESEYAYEKEIRLIYYDMENKCTEDIFKYAIDPNILFEEIVFDPRMNPDDYREVENELKNKFGFMNPISKSALDMSGK